MKKMFATLALAGLAGGAFAGVALAHQDPANTGLGYIHANEGNAILVISGNKTSIDGYVGVENDGFVIGCNGDNGTAGYQHGEGKGNTPPSSSAPSAEKPCS